MYVPAAILAAVGLGILIFAALGTEIEERFKRAAIGLCGLIVFIFGVMML